MNKMKIFGILLFVGIALIYPKHIKDPSSLSRYLIFNYTYQAEKVDYWKQPEETIKDKGGDCEDFAFLVKAILEDLGYETVKVIAFNVRDKEDKNGGHAICVFRTKDGKWHYFDNQVYVKTKYNTLKFMLSYYYGENFKETFEIYLNTEPKGKYLFNLWNFKKKGKK